MSATDLTRRETHFDFGENWRSFVATVDDESVRQAEEGLRRLFPGDELEGATFLDIGCGSGLSMLAASRLGAAEVVGFDIDSSSVLAAATLLNARLGGHWSVGQRSVFDLDPTTDGVFEIVYSWGVLHHTGDMWRAVRQTAAMVAPRGLFALALYRKTSLCGFWRFEKKIYRSLPPIAQAMFRGLYRTALALAYLRRGRNPIPVLAVRRTSRGMDTKHDLHDWMGGHPYESAGSDEVIGFLEDLGFSVVSAPAHQGIPPGLWGSVCDEFVARRDR